MDMKESLKLIISGPRYSLLVRVPHQINVLQYNDIFNSIPQLTSPIPGALFRGAGAI